jgi:AcrR family transcriptional regulator
MGVAERKAREKSQRRLQIMDAAKRVFSRKGFGGTTIEEIAQEAELSPATLYIYFKNKNELYASLNLRMLKYLCERVERVAARAGGDPAGRVRGLAQAMYDVYRFDPLILTNVFHMQSSEALRGLSPELAQEINDMAARGLRTMAGIFSQGMDQGVFRRHHPVALADLVWAVFSGLVLWEESKRIFDPGKNHLKPTLDLAMDLLARGLSAQPEAEPGPARRRAGQP